MARKRKHEEHVNHERWLVSYADFITLLFAFFVVMYAISSVNQGKYRVLSDSLVAAFRSSPKSMLPIQIGDPNKAAQSQSPQQAPNFIATPKPQEPRSLAPLNMQRVPSNTPMRESSNQPFPKQAHEQDLPRIAGQIEQAMAPLIERQLVAVHRDDKQRWLEVEIKASILFGSGSARLEREALPVLERLGGIMSQFTNPVEVRGYTDNRPINSPLFPSNWELSAARAASVVHLLVESGIAPERLAAIGYGEYQPLADNDSELGRSQNRRVSLLILADEAVQRSLLTSHPELAQPAPRPEAEMPAAPRQYDIPLGSSARTAPEVAPPVTKHEVNPPPVAVIPAAPEQPDKAKSETPAVSSKPSPSVVIEPEAIAPPVPETLRQEHDSAAPDGVTPPYTAPAAPAPEANYQAPVQAPAHPAPASPSIIQRKISPIASPIQLAPPVQMRLPVPGVTPVPAARARQQEAQ